VFRTLKFGQRRGRFHQSPVTIKPEAIPVWRPMDWSSAEIGYLLNLDSTTALKVGHLEIGNGQAC